MLKLVEDRQVLGQTSSTSPSQTAKRPKGSERLLKAKRNRESAKIAKSESECFAIKEASSSVKGISKFKLNFIERQGSR